MTISAKGNASIAFLGILESNLPAMILPIILDAP